MAKKTWFLVPRRSSGQIQRAKVLTRPLVDRIRQVTRSQGKATVPRSVKRGQWVEHAKRRAR